MVDHLNKKQIRSFVRREGRITHGQQHALESFWPRFGIEFNHQAINFNAAFERTAPCVLEIGFGNGATLAQAAADNQDLNFLGIEVHKPGIGHLLQLLDKHALTNVRIICHDAVEVLQNAPATGFFRQISVFFPDPWPKKRHHKRRLIQPDFAALLASLLEENGVLHVATDWADYAGHITNVMASQALLQRAPLHAALPRPTTRFEVKGKNRGHAVFDLVYIKPA